MKSYLFFLLAVAALSVANAFHLHPKSTTFLAAINNHEKARSKVSASSNIALVTREKRRKMGWVARN